MCNKNEEELPTKPDMDKMMKERFMPDGKTPRCMFCKQAMKNYTPKKGRFKGKLQEYCWVCDCKDYPKNMILSCG